MHHVCLSQRCGARMDMDGASPEGPWTQALPAEYSMHETGQLVRVLPSSLLCKCSTMLDKHLSKTR